MNEAKGRGVNTQEQTQGRCFLQTHPELWNPSTQSVLTCPYLQPCFPAYLAHSPNGCGGNTWSATGWATGRLQARSPLHSQGLPSTADAWTRGKSLFPQTFPHQKRVPLCSVGTSLKGQGSVHPCGWTGKRRRGSEPLGSPLSKAPAAPPHLFPAHTGAFQVGVPNTCVLFAKKSSPTELSCGDQTQPDTLSQSQGCQQPPPSALATARPQLALIWCTLHFTRPTNAHKIVTVLRAFS